MISIKTADELQKMREAGVLLCQIREHLKTLIGPGITTAYMDEVAHRMILSAGATPSFLGYRGYPYTLCTSVDDQVVHGFPNDTPLREGQIVSVDCGVILNGWQSDSAFTAPVGEVPGKVADLIRVTEECFWLAADCAREGNRLGDIGHAVQAHAEKNGFSVIRDMVGHGIGRAMHEEPSVPNYGTPGRGVRLKSGMVLAIEPMIAMGNWPVYFGDDGWAVITRDHSPCAHYEHTVAITGGEPEILTLPGAKVGRSS